MDRFKKRVQQGIADLQESTQGPGTLLTRRKPRHSGLPRERNARASYTTTHPSTYCKIQKPSPFLGVGSQFVWWKIATPNNVSVQPKGSPVLSLGLYDMHRLIVRNASRGKRWNKKEKQKVLRCRVSIMSPLSIKLWIPQGVRERASPRISQVAVATSWHVCTLGCRPLLAHSCWQQWCVFRQWYWIFCRACLMQWWRRSLCRKEGRCSANLI